MGLVKKTMVGPVSLLLCLSLYVSSLGSVLCFADQGHVQVEPAHIQHCCDADEPTNGAKTTPVAPKDCHQDCVDCSDISLNSPQIWQRLRISDSPIISQELLPQANSSNSTGAIVVANLSSTMQVPGRDGPVHLTVAATSIVILRC